MQRFQPQRAGPRWQLIRSRAEHLALPVWLETEKELEQENRCARCPGLRFGGGRVGDWLGRVAPGEAAEDLRELVAEGSRRGEHRADDSQRLCAVAVAREPGGDQ